MWEPIASERPFPVLMGPLLAEYDLDYFHAKLHRDCAGALVKQSGRQTRIILNETDSPRRRRFSAAHELGHYIRRLPHLDEDFEFADHRDNLAGLGTDPDEMFANAFAAELLMPEHLVRHQATNTRHVPALAKLFLVSNEAMGYRLVNLGLL